MNVSAAQFRAGLVDTVRSVLDRTGIDPGMLCLEVTESIIMDDVEEPIATLVALKSLGVAISIDDFGTGYSSLAYLKRFPLDEMKVDRSFVDGLGRDPEDTAIVAAVTAMAHVLGLSVVAEGVETAEQLDNVRLLGCELAQGYHLARPQDAAAFAKLLRAEDEAASNPSLDVEAGRSGSRCSTKDTVVIADDSPDVLLLADVSLASAGFEVHTASGGEEAISLVRAVRPSCVVLDVTMPGLSGVEVCRELRRSLHQRVHHRDAHGQRTGSQKGRGLLGRCRRLHAQAVLAARPGQPGEGRHAPHVRWVALGGPR